mmetsp:Transcript_115579/g.367466  ORF Transcript_115579/g.367466 Transcript_115579/m.367466 type:complete len:205 (-) Transcript_115579:1143-1757(-)
MFQHVGQCEVVVVDHLPSLVACIRGMGIGYLWAQLFNLHDVMKSRQAQHRLYPVHRLPYSLGYDTLHIRPFHVLVKLVALLLVGRTLCNCRACFGFPHLVHTETETLLTVCSQSEQPIHGEKRTHSALVLLFGRDSRRGTHRPVGEEQIQLRKSPDHVLEEISHAVRDMGDALCHPTQTTLVQGAARHCRNEQRIGFLWRHPRS